MAKTNKPYRNYGPGRADVVKEIKADISFDKKVVYFPGTQEQYERRYGHPVVIISTHDRDAGVHIGLVRPYEYKHELGNSQLSGGNIPSTEMSYICKQLHISPDKQCMSILGKTLAEKEKLIEQGIEAIINCQSTPLGYYGLPVAKAKS